MVFVLFKPIIQEGGGSVFSGKEEFMHLLYSDFYDDMISSGERYVHSSYPNREDIIHNAIVATFHTAQECYEKDNLYSHPNIRGWIYKVFYNRLRDEIKKSARYYRRSKLHPNEDLNRMTQVDIFDQWLANEEYSHMLEQIKEIRKTPIDEAVYQEYFIEKMSMKEIAEKREMTESTVKSIIYRMRKRAKKLKTTLFMLLFILLILDISLFIM